MEHPIFYYRTPHPTHDEPNLYKRLYVAVANDEKDEFMTLINDPGIKKVCSLIRVLENIFYYDALKIATAVYTGKTPLHNHMKDIFKDGMTPLHLAVKCGAPRLTKYFLANGYKVDAMCVHLSMRLIFAGPKKTIFNLLWWLCFHYRERMEIIRMLVKSDQNMWDKEAFINYALTGKLHKLGALFLAVPELFLSSPAFLINQRLELNSLKNKTYIQIQLSLLLDVFASVGGNIAAYIRLEEFTAKTRTRKDVEQAELEIEFFLRRAATFGKPCSREYYEYYFSFFQVEYQIFYATDVHRGWDESTSNFVGNDVFHFLPYLLTRMDFKRDEIYRLIPTLTREDGGSLYLATNSKLSSMLALRLECLKAMTSKILKRLAEASNAPRKKEKR